ncbi:hypothetical protein HDC94_002511 [Leifsonia sp. AK011]|uniref:hypothetical protein n=1 Tax=Leifsonia sp. AK011 TaxID=2723075 RepID=UPI0015C74E55|nr:hypothetical protein [Leifsonia sp. AK011]NYF11355.1 hypothetical protein [Leifsonia sp. AK011]
MHISATSGGLPPYLITPIVSVAIIGLFAWFLISRSRKAQEVAAAEPGVILSITTFPARPVMKQVADLRRSYGVEAAKGPSTGYGRPIAVLDSGELRMTLNGSRSTAYLSIPRSAITDAGIVEVRDRLMKARAIRLAVRAENTSLPLDLVVLDPKNPTNVTPAYVDAVFAQLKSELGLR